MKKTSLNELMGKQGSSAEARKLRLEDLDVLLGEKKPKIEYNQIGRMRLMNAFRIRFGDGFKNLPGISDIISEFDDEIKFNVTRQKMKMIGKGR